MKKVVFVFVLIMAVLAVNAQTTTPTTTKDAPVRTTVVVADLNKAIADNIAKDYAGYTVKEASSVTTNGVVTYEAVVVKGTTTETLVYDKDGKFLKKHTPEPKK